MKLKIRGKLNEKELISIKWKCLPSLYGNKKAVHGLLPGGEDVVSAKLFWIP
jgi:hypothetical protein